MAEWDEYIVGEKSTQPGWVNIDCQVLSKVSHVTHLEHAYSIIKRGGIRTGLVFDESKLNTERILVSWFSPNTWYHGSRYGNVSFNIDFKSSVAEMNFYWVESMRKYTPHAVRFLITPLDYSKRLEEYHPENGDGPWYYEKETDTHYWNGEFCLEFMFEYEIPLNVVESITFVDHHEKMCNIKEYNCGEKGLSLGLSKPRFFSNLLAHNYPLHSLKLVTEAHPKISPTQNLKKLFHEYISFLTFQKYTGNLLSTDLNSLIQLNSMLHFYAMGDYPGTRHMATGFKDATEAINTLELYFANKFNLTKSDELFNP